MITVFTIYLHEFPNGKRYVGMTSQSPERRWRKGEGYKSQPYLYREILKYGWDNIKHTVLAKVNGKAEAEELERSYILKYNSNSSDYGYNIESGGKKAKGYKLRQETRDKMSASRKGANNHNYGKHLSEDTKEKLSKAHLGKKMSREAVMKSALKRTGGNAYNARKVIQLDKAGNIINKFPSLADASRNSRVRVQDIYSCCTGRQKTSHGFGWKYDEE